MSWPRKHGMLLWLIAISLGATALAGLGCGGTSAETPWPVEPLDYETEPRGEQPPQEVGLDELQPGASTADAGAALDEP